MVVVIVEDNATWRNELALMYSRILSDSKEVTNYHPSIRTFATAREAIEYFKPKPGERSNASPKVDVLSLDLNLGRDGGGTGLDVLQAAAIAREMFVTIVISGIVSEDISHGLIELEISSRTKGKCFVHPKQSECHLAIAEQVNILGEKLRSLEGGPAWL